MFTSAPCALCGEMGFYVPIMWVEKGPFGAVLGLFWGHFRCFRGPQVPMCVDSAWECPGMRFEAFVSAALEILPNMTSIRRIWHLFASFTWD